MTNVRLSLLLTVLLPLVLVGCDSAGDTATLNENSTFPPTVEYLFEYDSGNQVGDQNLVEVTSSSTDQLGEVLTRNGFSRSTIVSAKVDSVRFVETSPGTNSASKFALANLRRASVFLGTDDSGTQIADGTFDPDDDSERVLLDIVTEDVTQTIKNGSTKAFLRLETSGDITKTDRVRVKIFYEITVSGV